MTEVRITVEGKLALTTGQAAAEHGVTIDGMRSMLRKLGVQPVTTLDGLSIYEAVPLRRALKQRPGAGRPARREAPKRYEQMAELAAQGLSQAEIARQLAVSESTVSRGLRAVRSAKVP